MKKFVVLCIVGLSILVARHAITADSPTTPKTAAAPEKAASLANLNPAQIPAAERFPWQPKELVAVVGSHRFRHWGTVTSVAFSPNGGRVASGGSDGYIRFWDTAGQETAALKTPDWSVNCIAYSPGRRMLLAGGEKGVVFVWKLGGAAPEELPSLVPSPSENPNPIHVGTAIDAIEFSADGKFLACSVGRQANVRVVLWDTSSWPPRELPSLAEATAPFAFAADSKTFYTQHGQGGIAAWDLTDDRPKKKSTGQLDNPRGQLLTMAVAPSGKRLATCYGDATAGAINLDGKSRSDVVLWDLTVSPPKPKAAFGEFKYDPMFYMLHAAAFSLDSNTLAFANKDRLVELWNVSVDPPKKQATLPGALSQAGSLSFAADGKTLIGSGNREVRIWELREGSAVPLGKSANFIGFAAVSPVGPWLATSEQVGSEGETVSRPWDLSAASPRQLNSTVSGMPFVFGNDGKLFTFQLGGQASGGKPAKLRSYEVTHEGSRKISEFESSAIERMLGERRIHPGGVVFVIGIGKEGELLLRQIGGKGDSAPFKLAVPANSEFHPNAASADGSAIAANVGDFQNISVKVWKLAAGSAKELATIRPNPIAPSLPAKGGADKTPEVKLPPHSDKFEGHEALDPRAFQLWTMAVAPAGEAVALADTEGTVQIWQLAGEKPRLQTSFIAHRQEQVMGAVQRMTFDSDGRRLLTVGSDRKLRVWDALNGKGIYTTEFPGTPSDASFSADGRHVLTLNPNGTIYILRLPEKP